MSQRLRIETFGHFAVRYGDREVVLNGRKARALLGYLVLADSGQETRERLVGLLWSETEEAKARASLRQTLYEIREAFQAVGFDKFDADKHVTRIDREALEVDLWDVMGGAKRGEPHAILLDRDRVTEGLLNEVESVDPAFRSWLMAKRQSLHDRLVAHLEDALRGQTNGAASANQERVARALMKLDATHEEAARALIRARVVAGDMGGALGIYKALWNLLDDEYDVEPSKETQELIAAVKLGQPSGIATTTTGRVSKRSSSELAVVGAGSPAKRGDVEGRAQKLVLSIGGFDLAGVGQEHRYLVQGFRSELTASLVRFREWSVRDQGHASAGAAPLAARDGEYIIDASAFDTSGGLRLILMLRDAVTNDYVWSERLQLSLDGWFDAQQSVVRRLATALNVHISAERIAAITFQPVQDLRAYDLWLRGHALLLNFAPKEWHEAEDLFRKIITEMPWFGPAYSSLANAQNVIHLAHPGTFRNLVRAEQALALAREAVRLDPIDTRAQLCLGWAYLMAEQFDMGEIHHGLAQELNESDPWTMISSALAAAFCGDHKGARARADRALSLTLDPSPIHWGYQSQIRFLGGDYRGALEAAQGAGPHSHFPGWKAAALFQLNLKEEGTAEFRDFSKAMTERWFGPSPSTPEMIGKWFLHSFPIKQSSDWERLRESVEGVGIPVAGLEASFWHN